MIPDLENNHGPTARRGGRVIRYSKRFLCARRVMEWWAEWAHEEGEPID